ncbi:MAG: CpsB/CapC family capsule biosynthesis tyrosine phosphatase [Chitinophagales bacterium]
MFNKLSELFGGKKETPSNLSDYSLMGADIHSHLIPGIDDGSPDMATTIEMLRQFKALGFKKIITSPHVVTDGYNNTTETIISGRDAVRAEIAQQGIDIGFDAIAEYYADGSMYDKIEQNDLLTFGKNYVLVEFSYLQKQNMVFELIYKLQLANYRVLLAHPERYPYYYESGFETYYALKDRNVHFQINLGSLLGKYGKGAKQAAEKMIDEKLVNFVGTDLHKVAQFESLRDCLKLKYVEKILTYEKLGNRTLV